ncbi:halo transducer protein [Haloplanus rubicundus]|uniref:Halo transducer protein n=1 Tax=Haloplanus rubicundus TaxID=1547898 RepID=A0A345EB72_9EURY|nr:halo transducer protein [Haloplanus rubicundus]AXG09444.1 halo transducer protein [Haloplanus rubicundus]
MIDHDDSLDGLSLDAAVDGVVARTGDDPDAVRAALGRVTTDGIVRREAVDDALAHVSKVVSTPETRVENAGMLIDDAREAAAAVDHLDSVAERLDDFETRHAAVASRVDDLGDQLQSVVDLANEPDAIYETAVEIRRLNAAANSAQHTADKLGVDAEEFEAWVRTPDRRLAALDDDADAVAGFVDGVAGTFDALAAGDVEADVDPAAVRFDAALRHRVARLLLDDLRAEVDDLRAWPDPGPDDAHGAVDAEGLAALDDRLTGLEERWRSIDDRFDGGPAAAWRDRYGDRLADFEAALDDHAPPVDWRAVESLLGEYRPETESAESA